MRCGHGQESMLSSKMRQLPSFQVTLKEFFRSLVFAAAIDKRSRDVCNVDVF